MEGARGQLHISLSISASAFHSLSYSVAAALLAVNGAAVLLLGPFSGGLLGLCRDAIVKALGS